MSNIKLKISVNPLFKRAERKFSVNAKMPVLLQLLFSIKFL